MLSHIVKDSTQRAHPEPFMAGNSDVMLSALKGRKAYMAARLTCHLIVVPAKQNGQLIAA
jgi:hypothetical protein